ncbi:MAG: acetylornithine deacetylase [Halieaceae bacterium]|jgi:acetylornithine deacetylase
MSPLPGLLTMLDELIATPSVSSTSANWDMSNRAVVDKLAGWLATLGFAIEIQELAPGKANLIATLGTGPGGLVLAGHTDTVPYDDGLWSSDPLRLSERDNRLYGLGSTDMKGFFPIAIEAAREFLDTTLQQPLIILATADEESSMSGARALVAAGKPKARQAIIGEPTGLRPVRLHKGVMMEAVKITGRSGHSSDPSLGNNALEGMHAVIADLLSYRGELQAQWQHPLFAVDVPTMNLGCIHGGDSPNRICGEAELHFDVRMVPGGNNQDIRDAISKRLQPIAAKTGLEISMRSLIPGAESYEENGDSELVKIAEQLTGYTAGAVAFATEAPYMQQLGMEALVCGPGSIDRAHQPDEYMELEQVQPAIDLLKGFIRHFCL